MLKMPGNKKSMTKYSLFKNTWLISLAIINYFYHIRLPMYC